MVERDRFTPDEWRTLQFAPFWMFSAVVGAYGNFDTLEYEAFARSMGVAAMAPGRLVREVMGSVVADLGGLRRSYSADRRTIASGLCEVAAVLARVDRDEAEAFQRALLSAVGEGVATARGRFGRVMSEEDEKTLDLVAQFLN